jgi:hypothetical protein
MTTTDPTPTGIPTPWQLARMADCADPDSLLSPGAIFLRDIYDAATSERDQYDDDDSDAAHSIADDIVPQATYDVWQTFTDLAAWTEDPTDLGFDGTDMEQGAKVCLYIIAERLALAVMEEAASEREDDDETDEAGA